MKEGFNMAATTPTQIRIEESTKKQAVELLEGLGLNLSDAVNMLKYPEFKPEVIEAMEEAKRISRDPNTKRYSSFSEALEDIDL